MSKLLFDSNLVLWLYIIILVVLILMLLVLPSIYDAFPEEVSNSMTMQPAGGPPLSVADRS